MILLDWDIARLTWKIVRHLPKSRCHGEKPRVFTISKFRVICCNAELFQSSSIKLLGLNSRLWICEMASPPKIPRGRMFYKQMVDFVAISANSFAFFFLNIISCYILLFLDITWTWVRKVTTLHKFIYTILQKYIDNI